MAYHHADCQSDWLKVREEEDKQRRLQEKTTPDGVYLFVLFPSHGGANAYVVGKDCVQAKSYMANGRFVGIAKKVFSYGFDPGTDQACIVLYFVDKESAVTFFRTEPHFKQPDFPQCAGHCQAWVVDRYYTPNNEQALNTFMISEVRLRNPDEFEKYKRDFATPFADLLQGQDARPYVVQTTEVLGLRRFCKDPQHLVTVHLFKNPIDVERVMTSERYHDLMQKHDSMAFEMCTVFTIDKQACP